MDWARSLNGTMVSRLSLLLDPGSFSPQRPGEDGELVGGTGMIEGRRVCIIAINPSATVKCDPYDILQQELALLDLAEQEKIPVVHLADRPGRVDMATTAIPYGILRTFIDPRGAGRIFARFARLSGIVPRIAVVFSPIATTLTYPVAECDTVVMLERAGMSLARPDMMKLMTHDTRPYEEYGGALMHTGISGTCDMLAASEREALLWIRKYLSYFPGSWQCSPPFSTPIPPVTGSPFGACQIPADPNVIFDMHRLIEQFVDEDSLLEHRAAYAGEIITAFSRIEGMPCGIIANNPAVRGGGPVPRELPETRGFCLSL
ncbi:MAG TPA: carboxyl transferase domain-containing protein [Methanoregula sp.]|nr:carboxyl transferase domain-containing protein [Methanoregula sp.]